MECQPDGGYIPPENPDGAQPGANAFLGRTNRWSLENPQLLVSLITLNSAVTAAFDKEISSSGLVLECRSYQAVNQSILSATTDLAYHISKSNITDVFSALVMNLPPLQRMVRSIAHGMTALMWSLTTLTQPMEEPC